MNNKKAYIGAIIYTILIGFALMFNKMALGFADPIDILAYRFTAYFLVILVPILLGKIELNYNKEDMKRIIPLAIFQPLLYFGLQTLGLEYVSSTEAAIIQSSCPIFIVLLAALILKEETNIYQKIFTLLTVVGVIYIVIKTGSSSDSTSIKGALLLILSALSFGIYNIMGKVLTEDFSSMGLASMLGIIGFVFFNTLAIGKNLLNGSMGNFFALVKEIDFIIAVIYLGVFSSLVTTSLNIYVLSQIDASKMSVFNNLRTVIGIVAGVVFLKEALFYYHVIGSVLIIIGVLGTNILDKEGIEKLKMRVGGQ